MTLTNLNIEERMQHYKVNGLSMALIENSQIKETENYGVLEARSKRKVNEHSIFCACSVSKFLTALTAIKLVEDGLLYLDENVNERLVSWNIPENEHTKNKKVTLRSLLSHQSGIKDPNGSFAELNPDTSIPSVVALLEGKTPYCKLPIEVQYEPESEFHYSDAGFCLIQLLIEDVTKKTFDQVVNELVFKPLGMKHSYVSIHLLEMDNRKFSCGHNRYGELVDGKYPIYPYPTASGLWTTSVDLASLALELMNALKGKSKMGISKTLAKEIITSQGGKDWSGLGVFLDSSGKEFEITSMGWGVGFQCMLVAYPDSEKGAVIMTNGELGVHQLEGLIGEIYRSLITEL